MEEDECFNIALAPQFNNQHSIFGIMQFFKDHGLMEHVSGIGGCSGGTIPAVFFGAGKDFHDFKKVFPKEGWRGFGPSEPKITKDFHEFVDKAELPERLEQMKIPVAISLSMWGTEKAMTEPNPNVTALVVNRGSSKEALTAALATGSEGGIPDPSCPKCITGFWPKAMGNASTITDGAFSDLLGVQALVGLPRCKRLLHILPLDYPGQMGALPASQIPGNPKDMVTLFFTQPPVASHGYFMEDICNMTIPLTETPLFCNSFVNWATGGLFVSYKPTERSGGHWNQVMFDVVNQAAGNTIDKPWDEGSTSSHKLLTLSTAELFSSMTTENEDKYNLMAEKKRDKYWRNFLNTLANEEQEQAHQKNLESSQLRKLEVTYEMPQIQQRISLNYPAA